MSDLRCQPAATDVKTRVERLERCWFDPAQEFTEAASVLEKHLPIHVLLLVLVFCRAGRIKGAVNFFPKPWLAIPVRGV